MTALTALHDAETMAERVLEQSVAFSEYLTLHLGLELGLYAALDGAGPTTASQLADRAGIAPRYAREWLEQQTAAGYLVCPDPSAAPDDRVFELPASVAAVLLDDASGVYLGPLVEMARGVWNVMDDVADAYRTGGGVPYAAYGHGIRHGLGALNGPNYEANLSTWIGSLPDVHARLSGGEQPRILDVGCGIGRSTLALARAYPRATVRGIDLDEASVADAREAAADAGLAHRVTFAVVDAAELADAEPREGYDLVTVFEALHDMGDPVGFLSAARSVLRPGGVVYVADERVADTFTPDADLVERLQYGFSVLHCLPATLAEDPVVANGTVLRRPVLAEWVHAAGFEELRELDVDDPFWRHYRMNLTPA